TADSGTGAPITCGSTSCNSAKEECCVSYGGGGLSSKCVSKGSCSRNVSLACSDGKACASGQVCCLTVDMSGGEAVCAKSCGGGGGSYVLCSSDADCTVKGETCRTTMLPGLKVCAGAGGPGGMPGG